MNYYEGKTRIYQFSPSYPLLEEAAASLEEGLYPSLSSRKENTIMQLRKRKSVRKITMSSGNF